MRSPRLTPSALVVLVVTSLTACSDSSPSTPQPTTSTSSTTATIPASSPSMSSSASAQPADEAKAALLVYRQTVDRVFQSGGKLKPELAKVAVAGQLSFLRDQADFLVKQGSRQTGTVRIKSIRVLALVSPKGRAPSATLEACVDSSQRQVVDKTGHPLLPADPSAIFLDRFTLVQLPGKPWLVAAEDEQQVKPCA